MPENTPNLILLTPAETAFRLRVSLRVLHRQIDAGRFPAPRRIGRTVRFLVTEVEAYAQNLPIHKLDHRGFRGDEPPQTSNKASDYIPERLTYDPAAVAAAQAAFDAEVAANQPKRLPRGPNGALPLP
jgi:excisionase family DNA binding protein